eukprot:119278-Chlamydomonas_euryale.AAC.1
MEPVSWSRVPRGIWMELVSGLRCRWAHGRSRCDGRAGRRAHKRAALGTRLCLAGLQAVQVAPSLNQRHLVYGAPNPV